MEIYELSYQKLDQLRELANFLNRVEDFTWCFDDGGTLTRKEAESIYQNAIAYRQDLLALISELVDE